MTPLSVPPAVMANQSPRKCFPRLFKGRAATAWQAAGEPPKRVSVCLPDCPPAGLRQSFLCLCS
jgi:hypothetical protein